MRRNILVLLLLLFAALSGAQEIPNAGFEEWVVQGDDTLPKYWKISPFGTGRTTDAVSGESAMSMWNWYCYAEGTLASAAIPFRHDASGGLFYLRGNYKYVLGQNGGSGHGTDDSAVVNILFRKYNVATKTSDTVGFATAKLGPSNDFQLFSIPVPVTAESDTLEFSFASSEQGFCSSDDCLCCYLTLDDIDWRINISGVDEAYHRAEDPAIPNPFETETFLGIAPDGGCKVIASTIEGIDVFEEEYRGGERIVLSVNNVPSGTYLYRIVSKNGTQSGKIIKR